MSSIMFKKYALFSKCKGGTESLSDALRASGADSSLDVETRQNRASKTDKQRLALGVDAQIKTYL